MSDTPEAWLKNPGNADTIRLARDRTLAQVSESGQYLYKKKIPGPDPIQEFFDLFVYLLTNPKKSDNAISIISSKNFALPEEKQIAYDEISLLKTNAYQYIEFCRSLDADEQIPADYQHLASLDNQGNVKLDFKAIADHLIALFHVVSFSGTNEDERTDQNGDSRPDIYVYDETLGFYIKNSSAIKNEIARIADVVNYKGSITVATREILFYVAYDDPKTDYPFNQGADRIPVLNGVLILDYDTGKHQLVKNSPDNLFTYHVPVLYDPNADPEPIDRILRQYVSPDLLPYLYQIPAQAILQGFCNVNTYRTAYLIQGAAFGGKSTYYDLLVKYLFSTRFCANQKLQSLCGGSQFATYSLPGKFLNAYDDLDDMGNLNDIGEFKNLIGTFNHSVEKKGQQRRNAKISCAHVFTCNRPPLLSNERTKTDRAWWERWVYIRFLDNSFEVDPDFQNKNFTEKNISGFFNLILEYAVKIRRDKSQFKRMPYDEVIGHWDVSSDTLSSFIHDCLRPLPPGKYSIYHKESFKDAYLQYCVEIGVDDVHGIDGVEKLSRLLFDMGFSDSREYTGKINEKGKKVREHAYKGPYAWNLTPGETSIHDPTVKIDGKNQEFQQWQ